MPEAALLLFWPALAGYAEAAIAYAGGTVRPGQLGRSAIWGVRIGWLLQTLLLLTQALRADGFPWGTWAESLNLFVWLTVGAYLIWGCRSSFRLLGLAVMPLAAGLLAASWAAGGIGDVGRSEFGTIFLALHVGLILAAFAGFTIAAALAALYLWQERRLKHHAPGVLKLRAPSLSSLDLFSSKAILVALPVLTLGMAIGFARLVTYGGGLDPIVGLTLLAWLVFGSYLLLRFELGWRGRRAAFVALAGFGLIAVVRLGLTPVTHF